MLVSETFVGKNIFLTGGSGFIGKLLIEKLLRSYDVENVYVLIRRKKGKTAQERLAGIFNNELYSKLKELNPNAWKKLIPVEGDVSELGLGISEEDRNTLIEKVNIVYHAAASVRFDDPLRDAVIINVRSTREIILLAQQMKNLLVFAHVSTTYCNVDKTVVEEKVYTPYGNWKDAIKLVEEADPNLVEVMTEKYIHPLPNTYTYAKSLAEMAVLDLCKGKIPAFIIRPAVVISTASEPFPGWIDNFNGPVGLLVAGGKGLLRTILGCKDTVQDYIPADVVIKLLVLATHVKIQSGNAEEVEVYHGSKNEYHSVTIGEVLDMGKRLVNDVPFSQILWYPRFALTNCWYNYYIQVLLFHMLPALFLDLILRIVGQKPMLFKIQRKIYIANSVLEYFIKNTWTFENKRATELFDKLEPQDYLEYNIEKLQNMNMDEIYQYFRTAKIAATQIMLTEKFDREKNLQLIRRLWLLDVTVKSVAGLTLTWIFFIKMNIVNIIYQCVISYVENLIP